MTKREIINEWDGPSRKHFQRVITRGINNLWQANSVKMGAFSKCNANDVSQAMARIFKSGHGKQKNRQTD